MKSFYDVLSCTEDASPEEIKVNCLNLLRKSHPDRGGGDVEQFELINTVWRTLRDPVERLEYDHWLREQRLRLGGQVGVFEELLLTPDRIPPIIEICRCGDELLAGLSRSSTAMSVADSVKILILGESGVGKSQLVNALVGRPPKTKPPATVGCAVTVIPHTYRAASPQERLVLVELWEIGGSASHRRASRVFVDRSCGVILVHDLSNKKSESNLSQWMSLLNTPDSSPAHRPLLGDVESLGMPALIVGCKQDQAGDRGRQSSSSSSSGRVHLDATQAIAPGSTNRVIFSRFFDSAIDRLYARPNVPDRRRRV